MREVAKPAEATKWEKLRRVRYGDVLKLIRHRYGAAGVPNDDAGRPDLMALLWLASAASEGAEKKVRNCIEIFAPWMEAKEVEDLMEHIAMTPDYEKAQTSEALGRVLHVTNVERERLRLWSIRPCDLTAEEFSAQSKEKKRANREAQRRNKGIRSRQEYLAELASRPKPWLAEGISRRAYERRKVRLNTTQGEGQTIVSKEATHLATPQGVERGKGLQGSGATGRPVSSGESEQTERQQASPRAVGPDLANLKDDLARVREARAAVNHARWMNRQTPKGVG
jgi:hypothetical protein